MIERWHFTAKHLVHSIKKQGLTQGRIPYEIVWGPKNTVRFASFITGYQWLTDNDSLIQDWEKRLSLPYSRTAYRLKIHIPESHEANLISWRDWYTDNKIKALDVLNGSFDKGNWWLYRGNIPVRWIVQFRCMI